MKVYQAINRVQAALAKQGISKDRRNTQGAGYNFRGIDDVYNAVSPLLAEHGLCILPRMLTRQCEERQSKSGGALFYITVEAEFDLVCAEDGSKHTIRTFGEAMDSGDKGTNKAMSAAYKYAAFQAFAIPTESDNDADAHTHEVASKQARPANLAQGGSVRHAVRDGIGEDLPEDWKIYLTDLAAECMQLVKAGKAVQAAQTIAKDKLDSEQRTYLENKMDSKSRAAIKEAEKSVREVATA